MVLVKRSEEGGSGVLAPFTLIKIGPLIDSSLSTRVCTRVRVITYRTL